MQWHATTNETRLRELASEGSRTSEPFVSNSEPDSLGHLSELRPIRVVPTTGSSLSDRSPCVEGHFDALSSGSCVVRGAFGL